MSLIKKLLKICLIILILILSVLILTYLYLIYNPYNYNCKELYQIQLKHVETQYNDHVGQDLEFYILLNKAVDLDCNEKYKIYLAKNENVCIESNAIEHDNFTDYGFEELNVQNKNINNYKIKSNVIVKESDGRYSGNTASFDFIIEFKRIVGFNEIFDFYKSIFNKHYKNNKQMNKIIQLYSEAMKIDNDFYSANDIILKNKHIESYNKIANEYNSISQNYIIGTYLKKWGMPIKLICKMLYETSEVVLETTINDDVYIENDKNLYKYTIKIDEVVMLSNNNVGNNWVHGIKIKDTLYKNDVKLITITTNNKPLIMKMIVLDYDDNPDYKQHDAIIKSMPLNTEIQYRFRFNIVENEGLYCGNTSEWEIVCTIKKENIN